MDGVHDSLHAEIDNITVPSLHCDTSYNHRWGPWGQSPVGNCALFLQVASVHGPKVDFKLKHMTIMNSRASGGGGSLLGDLTVDHTTTHRIERCQFINNRVNDTLNDLDNVGAGALKLISGTAAQKS